MTDRGDRFVLLNERPDDLDHAIVEPQIFRRPSAGDHERIVVFGICFRKIRIQREIVPWFFRIGLVAFEIVDRRLDLLTGLFGRAHGMNDMPERGQCLKRHHDLVVFGEIADQEEDLLG